MRREQDHRSSGDRLQVLHPFDPHHALDAAARRPPEDAALEEAAAEGPEMGAGKALAAARRHLRKAFFEIDARDAPPLRDQPVENRPDGVADGRDHPQREKVREPHEGENDPAHGAFSSRGLTPFGVL